MKVALLNAETQGVDMKSNPLFLASSKLHSATNIAFSEGTIKTRPGFTYKKLGIRGRFQGASEFRPHQGLSFRPFGDTMTGLVIAAEGDLFIWNTRSRCIQILTSDQRFNGVGDVELYQAENYLIVQSRETPTYWFDGETLTRSPGLNEQNWHDEELPRNEVEMERPVADVPECYPPPLKFLIRVLDDATSEPILGAFVVVRRGTQRAYYGRTDAAGEFSFIPVPRVYNFTVEKAGYIPLGKTTLEITESGERVVRLKKPSGGEPDPGSSSSSSSGGTSSGGGGGGGSVSSGGGGGSVSSSSSGTYASSSSSSSSSYSSSSSSSSSDYPSSSSSSSTYSSSSSSSSGSYSSSSSSSSLSSSYSSSSSSSSSSSYASSSSSSSSASSSSSSSSSISSSSSSYSSSSSSSSLSSSYSSSSSSSISSSSSTSSSNSSSSSVSASSSSASSSSVSSSTSSSSTSSSSSSSSSSSDSPSSSSQSSSSSVSGSSSTSANSSSSGSTTVPPANPFSDLKIRVFHHQTWATYNHIYFQDAEEIVGNDGSNHPVSPEYVSRGLHETYDEYGIDLAEAYVDDEISTVTDENGTRLEASVFLYLNWTGSGPSGSDQVFIDVIYKNEVISHNVYTTPVAGGIPPATNDILVVQVDESGDCKVTVF